MALSSAQRDRIKLAAGYLSMLLRDRARYRAQWAPLADKTSSGDPNQAAIAKVVSRHLREDDPEAYRLHKDRIGRALNGQVMTAFTLAQICAAFRFDRSDREQVWSILLGAQPAGIAFGKRGYQVTDLDEIHEVGPEGSARKRVTRQRVIATEDGLSHLAIVYSDIGATLAVPTGQYTEPYPCGDGIFAVDVALPSVLCRGESADLEYHLTYPAGWADGQTYQRWTQDPIDNVTLAVRFSRRRVPARAFWTVWSQFGEEGTEVLREPVNLTRQSRLSKSLDRLDGLVVGFRWSWN